METPQVEMFVYVAACGENEKGGPGIVWVDADSGFCKYMLLEELEVKELKDGLQDMIEDDQNENYFIVHKVELNAHIFRYSKKEAQRQLFENKLIS